jgi:hypothetical protein
MEPGILDQASRSTPFRCAALVENLPKFSIHCGGFDGFYDEDNQRQAGWDGQAWLFHPSILHASLLQVRISCQTVKSWAGQSVLNPAQCFRVAFRMHSTTTLQERYGRHIGGGANILRQRAIGVCCATGKIRLELSAHHLQ